MKTKKNKKIDSAKEIGVNLAKNDLSKIPKSTRMAAILASDPTKTKKQACIDAGYSPNTDPKAIENTLAFRLAKKTIDQQRKALQSEQGYSFVDSAIFYKDIASNAKEETADRIRARKALDTIQGYEAPKEQNVNIRGLLVELKDVSTQDLMAMAGVDSLD